MVALTNHQEGDIMLTKYLGIVLAGLTLTHCGQDLKTAKSNLASAVTNVPAAGLTRLHGVDDRGDQCLVELRLDDQSRLVGVNLSGTYTVDYKIPAPISGIYGVQRMPGLFDSKENIAAGGVKISKAWFGGGTVLAGTGKPLFWDVPDASHQVTVNGSLELPTSVVYSSVTKIAGILPFVTIDLNCHQLTP